MRYIPTLDGWRAVAILAVIFSHAFSAMGLGSAKIAALLHLPTWYIEMQVATSGQRGVWLFFSISGLLITSKLLEESEINLKNFYIRRAARILPASITYLLTICVLSAFGIIFVAPKEIVASALFFRNYLPEHFWYTGHFWSLSVEEHFYIAWPLLLVLLRRRAKWFALFGASAIVLWRWHNEASLYSLARYRTDMAADAIMLGSFAAFILPQAVKFLKGNHWLFIGCAIVYASTIPSTSLAMLMEGILAPILLLSTISNGSNILDSSLFRWIGRISYSLYLWQELFLGQATVITIGLRMTAIFLCAYASYRFVEKPMIDIGHSLTSGALQRRAMATSVSSRL